jgi:hypothetical protein
MVLHTLEKGAKTAKAGMIPIPKSVLAMLIDKVPDEEIVKIAEFFAETKVKDLLLVLRSDHSLGTFLDVFESWLRSSSVLFGKDLRNHAYSYVIPPWSGQQVVIVFVNNDKIDTGKNGHENSCHIPSHRKYSHV